MNASFRVLAHEISSQAKLHAPFGGVYPSLAKREHIKNLPLLLEKVLRKAKIKKADVIAVTYGPGLEPALWTGIVFAQELGEKWGIPVIPVNHMEGHLLSVFGKNKPARNATHSVAGGGTFKIPKIKTPLLALLVSGGHTQLVLSKKWLQYEIIGETLDDAVGEAFDKVARMLGLPYPGGPQISTLAEKARKNKKIINFSLPRPMLKSKDFNFSYSGLKTAVLYKIRDLKKLTPNQNKFGTGLAPELTQELALEFENAAIECLTYKTARALEKYKIKTLVVAGGVSANTHLQREVKKITGKKIKLYFPPKELTGDNGLMIGIAGYLNYLKNKKKTSKPESIKANGNLSL